MTIDKQALIAKIKKQTASFDTVVLKEDEANALLDELEAAEKRNTELVHNHRVHAARLINERGQLKQRIAELEAQSVTHDVGVMNIGNQYCEDFLVAWTVSGKSLPPGIYYLDARHAGDIPAGIGKGE